MSKKFLWWLLGTIAAAFVGWIVVSLLDGAFTPLSEEEIIQIMRSVK